MHVFWKVCVVPVLTILLSVSFLSQAPAQPSSESRESRDEPSHPEDSHGVPVHYSNNPVVAEVDGKPITLDELKNAQIHEMMERLYGVLDDALKQKVLKMLAVTHPEMAPAGGREITEGDIVNFYRSDPEIKKLGSLEALRSQIRNFLHKKQYQLDLNANKEKFQEAVDKGWVQNYLQPPNDFRLRARIGTAMLWFNGKETKLRSVFVMEYSDFLCPFCRKVQSTLKELRQKYAETVQFGFRHFPIHQEARDLSEAVECARDQGRFWQFQKLIFVDARRLQKNRLELILNARRAGVQDLPLFEKCLDSGKYASRVQKDFEEGALLGIQGTPTFIIGQFDPATFTVDGEMFSGAVPPDKFIDLIEKYLKLTQN